MLRLKPYLIILYFIVCVLLMALTDAFVDSGMKIWSHRINLFLMFVLISGPFIFKLTIKQYIPFIASLILWRIVGFDYLYNLFAHLPWDYHGSLKWWDRFLGKHPEHGIIFARVIFLVAAISISFKYLKPKNHA